MRRYAEFRHTAPIAAQLQRPRNGTRFCTRETAAKSSGEGLLSGISGLLPPGRCQSLHGQPAIKNPSGTRGSALSVEGPETPDGGHCLSGPAAALPPSAAQARQRLATTSRFTPIQTWVQDAERTDRSSTPVQRARRAGSGDQ